MNDNNGGTPNPLNPNPLDANPSEPMTRKVDIHVAGPAGGPINTPKPMEAPKPMDTAKPDLGNLADEVVEESTRIESVESLDPDGRPMEAVTPKPTPPKKKKTGLIIGLVISLFIAVGCGVVALLLFMGGEKDPVAEAMKKIMAGNMPANVVVDGDIEFVFTEPKTLIKRINIDLDSQAKTGAMINASTAEVMFTFFNDEELTFAFDEVYGSDGDLYFKVDGLSAFLERMSLVQLLTNQVKIDETDCVEDETGETDCATTTETAETVIVEEELNPFINEIAQIVGKVISVVDGEWLKISVDELSAMTGGEMLDSNTTCMINLIEKINTNSNSAAQLYNKNPFIASSTKNIPVSNKKSPVRQITIDDEKFANYVNSMQNSELTSELYNCLGWEGNVEVTPEDVAEVVSQIPAIYTEIDSDNNFSRLYMMMQPEDAGLAITIDLGFSYPATINVSEPAEYTSFEEIIQTIFMSVYNIEEQAAPAQ